MPGKADRPRPGSPRAAADVSPLSPADFAFLIRLERHALEYFLDNQMSHGLMLDRQHNHGSLHAHGWCSTATTGMGLIALALASGPPHDLLTPSAAATRIAAAVETVLDRLPHDRGILPHFLDSATLSTYGDDSLSTIDTAWLVAGALTAAEILGDNRVRDLADRLYERIDWLYWTAPDEPGHRGLVRHGKSPEGRFLTYSWDRLNGETVFMYILAEGAGSARGLPASAWSELQPFYGDLAGSRFCSADLGLFVFQYGLDLVDFSRWQAPGTIDLREEARRATDANLAYCRELAERFPTYRRHWGISPGDGPGDPPASDSYRCYSPSGPVDGTAHLTATLASIAHRPDAVLDNLHRAEDADAPRVRGRYGFSSVNGPWVARDMVGIDAGAAVLALDNYLFEDRVRSAFHAVRWVSQGVTRLGFTPIAPAAPMHQPAEIRSA